MTRLGVVYSELPGLQRACRVMCTVGESDDGGRTLTGCCNAFTQMRASRIPS